MSLTIASAIVLILSFIAKVTGQDLPWTEAEIESTVTTIIGLLAGIGIWWGRVRAGGVNWFGIRTK